MVNGEMGQRLEIGDLGVAIFIVMLPFLWVLWRISPCRRLTFWADMKYVAEGF